MRTRETMRRNRTSKKAIQCLLRLQKKTSYQHRFKPYIVKERNGSQITAERGGQTIVRNSSHYKKIKVDPDTLKDQEEGKDELEEIQIPNTPTIIESDKDPLPYVRNRQIRAAKPPEYLNDYVLT